MGVPEMAPVLPVKVRPVGNAPAVTRNAACVENGAVVTPRPRLPSNSGAPVAVTVWLYGVLTVPAVGGAALVIDGATRCVLNPISLVIAVKSASTKAGMDALKLPMPLLYLSLRYAGLLAARNPPEMPTPVCD